MGQNDFWPSLHNMKVLKPEYVSEIIEMALSDHTTFNDIKLEYGLRESEIKKIMRQNLKDGSYRAWRKRVKRFSKRREIYK